MDWCNVMKSMMKDILKAAMTAYSKSDNVAPKAVAIPCARPLFNVRCKQSIPIGPTGADTKIPIISPFNNIEIMLQISLFFLKNNHYLIVFSSFV